MFFANLKVFFSGIYMKIELSDLVFATTVDVIQSRFFGFGKIC